MTLQELVHLWQVYVNTIIVPGSINMLIVISPIALAVLLFVVAWNLWVDYVRSYNFLARKHVVLELRLPKETNKSPMAMETVLHALHNTADGSKYSQYWKGETRPWFSLEMVGVEGQVKFMIWCDAIRKQGVMNALYAQYPGIEIFEREDYTKSVHFDPKIMRIWAAEFALTKDDPYPIKTYFGFNLANDPKEEYKVDPLTHVIEFLGGLKPNQQNWIQIIIRAHKDEQIKPGFFFKTHDAVKDKAKKIVDDILLRNKNDKFKPEAKIAGTVSGEFVIPPALTKMEQDTVNAIEQKVSKLLFDVCIRAMYISPVDTFDTPYGIGGNISAMKQFNTENWNGFKPGDKWHSQFKGQPWEDFKKMKQNRQSRLALMAYKRRSAFYTPFQTKTWCLNTEELATMYHLPGSTSATPALERVPSKKSTAPSNLPI